MTRTLFLLFLLVTIPGMAQDPTEARIEALLRMMTMEEKLGQLWQVDGDVDGKYRKAHPDLIKRGLTGSTLNVRGAKRTNELQRIAVEQSRLKIPVLFAFDVIHGYRTIFPVPLGEAASWDPALAEQCAAVAATEALATGLRWTFAPMMDIARDPRWGRIVEGAGEDPVLASAFAWSRVKGFQRDPRMVACAKHWVAYGAAQAGRDYHSTDLSERALREIYFPPFRAAVDAGVGTVMSSFNELNGVPVTGNPWVLTDVLRKEWGFRGMVVSDWGAVDELISHGLAHNGEEAAVHGITAGVDMEMVTKDYTKFLPGLLRSGRVPESVVDEAVRRVLRTKFRVGLFDNPYTDETLEARVMRAPAHRELARRAAQRSFVLLKNDKNVLPFSANPGVIAVVGKLADSKLDMLGSWYADGRPEDVVTLLAGLRARFPRSPIIHARTPNEAIAAARQANTIIVAIGETADLSGEAASRTRIDILPEHLQLVQAVHGVGKPYAVVLMNGRPLTLEWVADNAPAILETWFSGTEGGHAMADVLFGDVSPGGKLPVTFPRSLGQVPIFYNYRNTGRPSNPKNKYTSKYLDESNHPRYVFGYGLSYTKFNITNLRVGADFKVQVDVQNVGKRVGDEVVQLYIHDVAASVARPVRELKAFRRVTLQPGEKQTVVFQLKRDDFAFLDRSMRYVVEPGPIDIYVGNSSAATLKVTVDPGRIGANH